MHVIDTAVIPWTLVSKSNRPGRVHRQARPRGIGLARGSGTPPTSCGTRAGTGRFSAPRHKHNFDQIRYVVSGDPDFGHYQVALAGPVGRSSRPGRGLRFRKTIEGGRDPADSVG